MATSRALQQTVRSVKPVLSVNNVEARRRVLNLYKAWYRQIPNLKLTYDVHVSEIDMQKKLREKFHEKRNVTDIRVIDLLVLKGQMDLVEMSKQFAQKSQFMNYFNETIEPKETDFLTNFYSGAN